MSMALNYCDTHVLEKGLRVNLLQVYAYASIIKWNSEIWIGNLQEFIITQTFRSKRDILWINKIKTVRLSKTHTVPIYYTNDKGTQ